MKLSSWPEIGSDGDVLLTPYVPKGITGYDDDDDDVYLCSFSRPFFIMMENCVYCEVRTKSLYKHAGLQVGSSVDYHLTGISGRIDYVN